MEAEEEEELGSEPNEALRRLGRTHLLVVDRAPDDGRQPILLDPESGVDKMPAIAVDPEPLFVVHPAGEGGRAGDGNLPAELTFPLTQLWQLERPGPLLRLHALR